MAEWELSFPTSSPTLLPNTLCCQLAEILARKFKGAREKSWQEELMAEFWPNYTKNGKKRDQNLLEKK
jgi:hypothetical protein